MAALARLVAVRSGEGRTVALVGGAFAAVEMGRGLGEVGVDTLILSRLGQGALPPLYIGLGVVGLVTTLAYGAALARTRSERFFPGLLLVLAVILVVEWLIALAGVEAAFPLLWISVYTMGMLLLTVTWTIAGGVFDARQAKRLFPLLTSAAIVGSLAGFIAAVVIARVVGAEQLILAEAILFVGAAALLGGLGPRLRPRRAAADAPMSIAAALSTGATYVVRSPLMRLVAVAYVLFAILLFSLSFGFMTAMSEAFPSEDDLLTALALFAAVVTAASFLIGVLLANRAYARFGVATVAVLLPLVYLVGFGAWLVRFTLATAIIVRLVQQVTQRGLSNAAWGAFFSVVPATRRGPVMAFIDGVPGQIGTVISGAALILASRNALEPVFAVGFAAAAASLVVVLLIRRAYAQTLIATLRSGLAEQVLEGGPGLAAVVHEPGVLEALREAARSERATERLLATELLARTASADATAALVELAGDPDPGVRRAAVTGLASRERAVVGAALSRALDDPDAEVRIAAIRGLGDDGQPDDARAPDPDAAARLGALRALAADPEPRARAEVAVALAAYDGIDEARAIIGGLVADERPQARTAGLEAIARIAATVDMDAVADLRGDAAPMVRAAALRATAAHPGDDPDVFIAFFDDPAREVRLAAALAACHRAGGVSAALGVLADGSPVQQETALDALIGHEDAARAGLVTWADRQVVRAAALRGSASGLAQASPESSAAFLGDVLGRRADGIVSRLLTALALLGAPEASGLIRRCLRSVDPEVRAQAIEALDTIGDARLARGVVRLLDSDAAATAPGTPDVATLASTYRDDDDAWVRALALTTLWQERPADREALEGLARIDADPVVRAVAGSWEAGAVNGAVRLVSDLDRMLVLRRVPIFAALDPEDLQRVAALATERRWDGGDALMVEGDVGAELVVIVDGEVRIVHRDASTEHLLRRYGPGDHIGELAVLREAPRAATVIAEEPGVRGLVIGGEAIHALLRERPEAAMAMLATLADRLSTQA